MSAPAAEISTGNVKLRSGGDAMGAYVAGPAGIAAGPGIIVFQEAFGVNAHTRDVCERFARLGFTAIAPQLFHRTGTDVELPYGDYSLVQPHMSKITNDGLVTDAHAAFDWLEGEARVERGRIAAAGFCLGGRAAYLANAHFPLRAAISFYGGGIAPDLLDLAGKQHGPILMFWGGLDKHITSDHYRAVADALTQAGATHEQVVFHQADHAFFNDARPNYNAMAAPQAWSLIQSFLRVYGVLPENAQN